MHPSPLLGQDDSCVVVWLTPRSREILDLDHLMRIVNRRTKGVLPPVTLPQKMRDRLMRDKEREDEGSWKRSHAGGSPSVRLGPLPQGMTGLTVVPAAQ